MRAYWSDPAARAAAASKARANAVLGPCFYCGEPGTSRDHVIPRSKGGSDEPSNVVIACQWCNSSKRNRTLEEWRAHLEAVVRLAAEAHLRLERMPA